MKMFSEVIRRLSVEIASYVELHNRLGRKAEMARNIPLTSWRIWAARATCSAEIVARDIELLHLGGSRIDIAPSDPPNFRLENVARRAEEEMQRRHKPAFSKNLSA